MDPVQTSSQPVEVVQPAEDNNDINSKIIPSSCPVVLADSGNQQPGQGKYN